MGNQRINTLNKTTIALPIELILLKRRIFMEKFECVCGYVYDEKVGDPDGGIEPGTKFEDIPDDWVCPICGLGKDAFTKI